MSMTMEQVVTDLQQEFVHAESSKGSRIWTCRRSESEEDFQEWLKKTEAFFAGVIQGV